MTMTSLVRNDNKKKHIWILAKSVIDCLNHTTFTARKIIISILLSNKRNFLEANILLR